MGADLKITVNPRGAEITGTQSPAEPIDRLRERAAWIEQNVLPYEREIRAWLSHHRNSGLEIDDIVQEMYAKIGSLDDFGHIRDPKRYALKTAHFVLLNHVRRSRILSISSSGDLTSLTIASPDATPEQRTSLRDEIREITSIIATLPERTRDVLLLRRVEGLSQRETADRLSIAEKTVEKHLARAVMALMSQFGRGGKGARRASSEVRRFSADDENK